MPKYFKLFSCCIPIKGFLRAIIYDVQRKQYLFVPNEFCDLLDNSLKFIVPTKGSDGFTGELIDYLLNNEFGFLCTAEEWALFPQLDLGYESFYDFDSLIFDLNKDYNRILKCNTVINETLLVNVLQIRLFFAPTIAQLNEIVLTYKNKNTCSIELIIPFSTQINQSEIERLVDVCIKITSVCIFSSPYFKSISHNQCTINYWQEKVTGEQDCGKIEESLFSCNLQTFCESQNFNTCLSKKLSIDVNGNIKNCPSFAESFGNIKNTTIVDVLSHPNFKKLWSITKDQIDVCKDCEFRHMCTDCRAYIKDPDNIYSQPAKCTYNPYIAKWQDEEGYVSIEECGTYSKETGFVLDIEKVEAINLQLWAS